MVKRLLIDSVCSLSAIEHSTPKPWLFRIHVVPGNHQLMRLLRACLSDWLKALFYSRRFHQGEAANADQAVAVRNVMQVVTAGLRITDALDEKARAREPANNCLLSMRRASKCLSRRCENDYQIGLNA